MKNDISSILEWTEIVWDMCSINKIISFHRNTYFSIIRSSLGFGVKPRWESPLHLAAV